MRFYQRVLLCLLIVIPWAMLFLANGSVFPGLVSSLTVVSVRLPSPEPPSAGRASQDANKTKEVVARALKSDSRPPLVRFHWYVDGNGPLHYGYGGDSAMTIFSKYGYVETSSNDWDLLWSMLPQWENMAATGNNAYKPKAWQIHNHCLGLRNNEGMAGTKESQWKHVLEMRMRYGEEEFDFMPETLILPDDITKARQWLQRSPQPWIMKPTIGKQAIGVQIVANKKQLPNFHKPEYTGKRFVLQQYVTEPLLVDGRKFHLRLYLVLTSLTPLRVLIHDEGLVLFAVHNYSADMGSLGDMKIHLTNSAVADRNNAQGATNGWLLSKLWKRLEEQIGAASVKSVLRKIDDAFVKLALSAQLVDGGYEQRRSGGCFDLFGIDVLIDKNHKPHVMEVNVGPELVSPDPSTHQANDLAHKAVLKDLIPLVTPTETNDNVKKLFEERLLHFMTSEHQSHCAPSAFVLETAKCLTSQDVEDLWRLHRETEMLGDFRRLYPTATTSRGYTQYFHAGLDPRNYWALKWVDMYYANSN